MILIEPPPDLVDEMRMLWRDAALARLAAGLSEDEIYRRGIDAAVQAARRDGCDEGDVEVAGEQARRDIAEVLAEGRGW
jgi:hypothetical protein